MQYATVVVTDDRFGDYSIEEEILKEVGLSIEIYNFKTHQIRPDVLRNADALLVNQYYIDHKVIKYLKKCKIISLYGVGFDRIDINAATKAGIWVARVPDYCYEDVSDHALALLLACIRKIPYKDKRIREGGWNLHKEQPIYRIKEKVLGIIGYGSIARAFHQKTTGLGLSKVLIYDPYIEGKVISDNKGCCVDFRTLLRESDYISIHVPLTVDTHSMIGEKEIFLMKKEVIIINTSRGPILQEAALFKALKENRITYAGLDVFEEEPIKLSSPLLTVNNVILSDHTGYYSEESIVELKTKAAINILNVFKGLKPPYPINNISEDKKIGDT